MPETDKQIARISKLNTNNKTILIKQLLKNFITITIKKILIIK